MIPILLHSLHLDARRPLLLAETVTLASVPAKVRAANPSLAAARLRIEEARGQLLGAGRLSNPELGLGYLHDRRFGEAKAAVSFDQKFPVTARLRLEKALSGQLVTAAELEVRDAERQLIAEAQALAVKLLSLEQQRALRAQQTELAQKLSSFAAGRAAAGEISALDAAQAQVDSQRLLLEGNKLETERVSLIGELKPKLGVAAEDSLAVTGDLPATAMPARASWEQRADYQLALVNESAARTGIDLAKARKWEDITVGLLWEGERMEDAPNGLENAGFFGLKLSIPLPFWNKNQGEIAEKIRRCPARDPGDKGPRVRHHERSRRRACRNGGQCETRHRDEGKTPPAGAATDRTSRERLRDRPDGSAHRAARPRATPATRSRRA